ncbi:hypothetical protein VFPFJ_00681 [Purpureocillium lilacinum]|uniref:Uncharacterized protein n=1 Tax=Purpureocillium lilacinum TaxID=33203 RepID=A0A179HB07_PURLI|nr:hypothetical protein VFPFJ_00681 [Purpureocillium lilacinum]OAQ86609.1 hypothetical protein VFPBJ_00649 [Purpureocillium lilacinum]OAQ94572.1 hypothetical protein VFPFJ_00681 [Purpureocillium lilacinum]
MRRRSPGVGCVGAEMCLCKWVSGRGRKEASMWAVAVGCATLLIVARRRDGNCATQGWRTVDQDFRRHLHLTGLDARGNVVSDPAGADWFGRGQDVGGWRIEAPSCPRQKDRIRMLLLETACHDRPCGGAAVDLNTTRCWTQAGHCGLIHRRRQSIRAGSSRGPAAFVTTTTEPGASRFPVAGAMPVRPRAKARRRGGFPWLPLASSDGVRPCGSESQLPSPVQPSPARGG